MKDFVEVTGMVLTATPVGESDKRVVILTKERGKITAFARGARRPGSRFLAATNPFSFGGFKLYEGRNAYTLADVTIQNYFEQMRTDYDAAMYGMYFLEVMDYYTRENNDECEMLKLLYQSLRALINENLDNRLVRCIFEMKTLVIQGEFPGEPKEGEWLEGTLYAIGFIMNTPIRSLYTFGVKENVLLELQRISEEYCKRYIGHHFHSLDMII